MARVDNPSRPATTRTMSKPGVCVAMYACSALIHCATRAVQNSLYPMERLGGNREMPDEPRNDLVAHLRAQSRRPRSSRPICSSESKEFVRTGYLNLTPTRLD